MTQPTPTTRRFTQKDIVKLVCKVAGLLFILQTFLSAQKIFFLDWTVYPWSRGNTAMIVEVLSNAIVSWALFTKQDWITEKLDAGSDEVAVSIGKQELLEIVIIIAGGMMVITSISGIADKVVHFVYVSGSSNNSIESRDITLPVSEIFSGLFVLGLGLVILRNHKGVLNWISRLKTKEPD